MTPLDLLVLLLVVSGLSMAGIGLYARRYISRVPAATPFILLMFLAAAWSVVYALSLLAPSLQLMVFYHNLRFLFLPFIPVTELWLVFAYVNRTDWIRRDLAALALIIPLCAVVLGLTGPYHTLFRFDFFITFNGVVPVLHFTEGPFYSLYNLYSLALLVLALLVLVVESRQRGTLWEMPTLLLFAALAFPTVVNYLAIMVPAWFSGLNPTPALLWIAALLYLVALFRYRFLDIIPVARSRVIETMRQPILVMDMDKKIIDANPAADQLFPGGREAVLGRPAAEAFSGVPDLLSLVQDVTAAGREISVGGRTFEAIIEPVASSSGRVLGSCILLRDITERRKAQEALRQSEEKYRAIIENMQDMVFRTDTEGYLLMVSPSGALYAGTGMVDSLIGRPVSEFYADPGARHDFLAALQETGSVQNYPLTLKTTDGIIRFVTVSSHYYHHPDGAIAGIEGVIHDITDLHIAEEALRTANKKLNLLAGITRHDIKNQLMALRAYIELSKDSLDERDKLLEYFTAEERITTIIDHQISFTRDYEDLGVQSVVWQDVDGLIREAAVSLPLGRVRLEIRCTGLEVYADPLLGKVFYNLIDNSLRYGREKLSAITVSVHHDGRILQVLYEDNGEGIPTEDKKQLFRRGFGKNTGLGLFLSREILSITGITIDEDGEPGRGVRFVITVPDGRFRFRNS